MAGSRTVVIIGGGPAGLMAASVLAEAGIPVAVYDGMPSVGRKFLLAGIGGMNITHSEPLEQFIARYGDRRDAMRPMLEAFGPDQLRRWIHGLGIETFTGSSGRVFPKEMKAAPLLRAWLHHLRSLGVNIHTRHRWQGWDGGELVFETPAGRTAVAPGATVLAPGGASWPRLGSDAAWVSWLRDRSVDVRFLRASNAGFEVNWSEHFRRRFAGQPVKPAGISFFDHAGNRHSRRGEFIVTERGIEGSLVYALSAPLRELLDRSGSAGILLDLLPDLDENALRERLSKPRKGRSLSEHLRRNAGLHGVKAGLLREGAESELNDPQGLAARIKALPLHLERMRPLEEAISTAGGVAFEAMDEHLMLRELPGVFCAGEMLDWEAPTGGYLLTACFATGRAAGRGVVNWLDGQ